MSASLFSGLLPHFIGPDSSASAGGGTFGPVPPFVNAVDSTVGAQTNTEYRVPSTNFFLTGLATTTEGASTRLQFQNNSSASDAASFRAGSVTGTDWDAANRGANSAAFGVDNKASGAGSFAAGSGNVASGAQSVALGMSATASSANDFVWSDGSATVSGGATTFNVGAAGGVNMWSDAGRSVLTAVAPSVPGITTSGGVATFGSSDAQNTVIKAGGSTVATMTPALASTFAGTVVGNSTISARTGLISGSLGGTTGTLALVGNLSGGTVTQRVGTSGASYTIGWPVAQGAASTVLSNDGAGNLAWSTVPSLNAFVQNGNSFGATATLGTNDAQSLVLETNNTAAVTITSAQAVGIAKALTLGTNGGTGGSVTYNGSTSGNLQISPPAAVTSYALVWPTAQGAATSSLTNDGAGNLSWATAATNNAFVQDGNSFGATATLGTNDANSLVLETNNLPALTIDNTQQARFQNGFLTGTSGSSNGSITFNGSVSGGAKIQAASTITTYTVTWPSAQGAATTVLTNDGSGNLSWATPAANGAFVQGGNSFGATGTLGTNDANSLILRTNSTTAITVSTAQVATLAAGASFTNALASYVPGILRCYESQTSVAFTFTGPCTINVSGLFTRIGDWVYCYLPSSSAAANGSTTAVLAAGAGAIPARFRPPSSVPFAFRALSNSAVLAIPGMASFMSDGDINLFPDWNGALAWATTGNDGWQISITAQWPATPA